MQIYTPLSLLSQAAQQFCGDVRRLKEDSSVHTHLEAIADRNLDGWLDAQILPGDLRPQLAELLADRAGCSLTCRGRREQRSVLPLRQLNPRCQCARDPDKPD